MKLLAFFLSAAPQPGASTFFCAQLEMPKGWRRLGFAEQGAEEKKVKKRGVSLALEWLGLWPWCALLVLVTACSSAWRVFPEHAKTQIEQTQNSTAARDKGRAPAQAHGSSTVHVDTASPSAPNRSGSCADALAEAITAIQRVNPSTRSVKALLSEAKIGSQVADEVLANTEKRWGTKATNNIKEVLNKIRQRNPQTPEAALADGQDILKQDFKLDGWVRYRLWNESERAEMMGCLSYFGAP